MFHEVDRALHALLRAEALGDAPVKVVFDPPNRPWIATVKGPTINVFLYDVRENVSRREVMLEPVYDEAGSVVARRQPARRYDLYYTISVWAPSVALEHQILAAVTAMFDGFSVFPPEHLPEGMAQRGQVFLDVAGGMKRMMPGNLGGDLKLQIELVVTVPMPAKVDLPTAPKVNKPMALSVKGEEQSEQVQGRPAPNGVPSQRPPSEVKSAPPVDPSRTRSDLATAAAAAQPPGTPDPSGPAGGPPGQAGPAPGRPSALPPGTPGGPPATRPADPMAQVRAALTQAAQVQAALAQAQAGLAQALARASGATAAPQQAAHKAATSPAPGAAQPAAAAPKATSAQPRAAAPKKRPDNPPAP